MPDAEMTSGPDFVAPSQTRTHTEDNNPTNPVALVALPDLTSPSLPALLLLFSLSLKFLLFPARFSTDFEVHRHWKALTHSLPLSQWYFDESSKWTLDYPPLFAYLECALSYIAAAVHPPLVLLSNHDYEAKPAIFFMRSTVLLSDILLFISLRRFISAFSNGRYRENLLATLALVLLSPGLTLVDNIHFQYNGFVIAILMLSLSFFYSRSLFIGAIAFVAALNLKHTLLPVAPVVAIYILSTICTSSEKHFPRVVLLSNTALATVIPFTVLWMPLYVAGGTKLLQQAFSRMFPFDRGLLHSYWAPNFWALYATLDKLLISLGYSLRHIDVDPTSGHIGGRRPFAVLPNPTPAVCTTAIVAFMIPALLQLARRPKALLLAAVHATLATFFMGWHVHEKAVLVPLSLLAVLVGVTDDQMMREAFFWLSSGGQLALFPLIQGKNESMYKVIHFIAYHVIAMKCFMTQQRSWRYSVLTLYVVGSVFLELYAGIGGLHQALFGKQWQFLPLMLVSVYGSIGVLVAFGMITKLSTIDGNIPG